MFNFGSKQTPPSPDKRPLIPETPMDAPPQYRSQPAPVTGLIQRPNPYKISKCPTEALAMTNCVILSPKDVDASLKYIMVDDQYPFTVKTDNSIPSGEVGTSIFHRRFGGFSLNQEVKVRAFDPMTELANPYLGMMHVQVSYLKKGYEANETFDASEMAQAFLNSFTNQVFSREQTLVFDFHGVNLVGVITGLESLDINDMKGALQGKGQAGMRPTERGIIMNQTEINFSKGPESNIKLKGAGSKTQANAIIQPTFKFEDLGIGGLDSEFSAIFRRAFASRIFPPALVEKLGIQHVKGILLYGPPGTGKTLMARQIGKMLNAKEPLIVNGPEVLNKYVGQSEENIRKLFAPAEADYKALGEESPLHIIIFDELDAICKQRGGKQDGTGVGDSVVNQLLAKMDGVEQLNNILIIGMTNRLDMIDEALLRPGRLEIHMEISLPDEKGRVEILKIHTSKMRTNDLLAPDVDINELASLTKNFSGAEIAGLCKSASSWAFNRHIKVGSMATVSDDMSNIKISRDDFMRALEEVKPAFGVSEEELSACVQNGVIPYSPIVDHILQDGQLYVSQVKTSTRTPLVSVLLHGPPASGKTALAATIAIASEFPFVKLISPESMVGYSELSKMTQIKKVFDDAYKSQLSVVVIDNLERLVDWVPIGPRFSNAVLQTLLVLLRKPPPKDRRLLILATTSQRAILDQLDMGDVFDAEMFVPPITELATVEHVLKEVKLFEPEELVQVMKRLNESKVGERMSIGIKKLLMIVEMSRQDEDDKISKFVDELTAQSILGNVTGGSSIIPRR